MLCYMEYLFKNEFYKKKLKFFIVLHVTLPKYDVAKFGYRAF
jgi:hypothetical protein